MTPQENVSVAFPLFLIFFLKHLTGRTLKAAPFLDGLEYSRGAYSAMSRAMVYQVVKASSEGGRSGHKPKDLSSVRWTSCGLWPLGPGFPQA